MNLKICVDKFCSRCAKSETVQRTQEKSQINLRNGFRTASAFLAMSALAAPILAQPSYDYTVVAKLGDPAPGGGVYEGYAIPMAINEHGDVLFDTYLSSGSEGLFLWKNGVTEAIVDPGMPAPGTSNAFGGFGGFQPLDINDHGDMAIAWSLDVATNDPVGFGDGIWRYNARRKTVTKVFAPGDRAPGGTTFRGSFYHTSINNSGILAAVGMIDTPHGVCQSPGTGCYGLGLGIFTADKTNRIRKVVAPGDAAPGGGTFDGAEGPEINDHGDIAFGAHVTGEECLGAGFGQPRCFTSQYLYRSDSRRITSIAHQGDPAPGGGTFGEVFDGHLNDNLDMVYIGSIWASGTESLGVFGNDRNGGPRAIARPGDSLPGGTMKSASFFQGMVGINNDGWVAFAVSLTEDSNADGAFDTGVYVERSGKIGSVVRTGTVIPGLGKVARVDASWSDGTYPYPTVSINDEGQVLTQVVLDNGDNYIIVASPQD